jgi:Na+/melibiose symporter-like transporter
LFTKTTPVLLRGRLIAVRQLVGSLLGIVGGSVVAFVLSTFTAPLRYSILFFCAFLASIASYAFLRKIREECGAEESTGEEFEHAGPGQIASVLRTDQRLRRYLIGDALILAAMTSSGFYAVYGLQKLDLPESAAGMFTMVSMAGMVIANLVFGHLADRYGHKLNLLLLLGSSLLSNLVVLLAGDVVMYAVAFVLMSFTISLQGISRLPFVAELCSEADRPVYIAIVNTVTAPLILVGVAAGAAAKAMGYEGVFWAYTVVAALGLWWFWRKVEEPRSGAG